MTPLHRQPGASATQRPARNPIFTPTPAVHATSTPNTSHPTIVRATGTPQARQHHLDQARRHQRHPPRPLLPDSLEPRHRNRDGSLIDAHTDWLTVFYLPAYAPELNPAGTVWSLLKRSVVNFLATDLDDLAGMIKHRLKVTQHHPGVIDSCLAPTGLTLNTKAAITN